MTERASRARRLVDLVSALLLVASAGLVLAAATPLLVRLMQPSAALAAKRGLGRALRGRGIAVPAVELAPAVGEPDPLGRALPALPGLCRVLLSNVGIARRALALRAAADSSAEVVGEALPGSVVLVAREQGQWLLVVRPGGEPAMGWVRRADVAVQ
ncbi:MAG: SH3 domain-containing protein [Deltaproteobacteria bacterium]|nr:SH3 domain-containing protein [Deltaproteobacteria bacterium]